MTKDQSRINSLICQIRSIGAYTSKEDFWNVISKISRLYEQSIDVSLRRCYGIYYTDLDLAKKMIDEMFDISLYKKIDKIDTLTFFEPCVGTGNFVFAYLKKLDELNIKKESINKILKNIYICDIDKDAINIFVELMIKFCKIFFDIELTQSFFKDRMAYGLLFDLSKDQCEYISIKDVFSKAYLKGGFDIIVTNPPYRNLKAEKDRYQDLLSYEKEKQIFFKISKYIKKKFKYSNSGVLNLYKLFVEEIICNYSQSDAIIYLLIPSTILTDKSCENLRTMILENHSVKLINTLPEKNEFVNAQQALCTMLIEKGNKTDIFYLKNIKNSENVSHFILKYEDIKSLDMGNSIFALSEPEYEVLKKLKNYPKIKDLPFVINMRGELDLTANKSYITSKKTDHLLLRGRNISFYGIKMGSKKEYVKDEFVFMSSKSSYIFSKRIACQQIANIHKERRLTFAFIPEGYVLANSCNFLYVLPNPYDMDIYALLGIMNSDLINWVFKMISSNNHINNYEIDMLPIPIDSIYLKDISNIVQTYLKTGDDSLLKSINNLVNRAYNLSENDKADSFFFKDQNDQFVLEFQRNLNLLVGGNIFKYSDTKSLLDGALRIETLLAKYQLNLDKFDLEALQKLVEKYTKINKGIVLNHITFKLSNLDLEIIKSVPQGGNWKNIPNGIIEKSKRLMQIKKSGGRTTLYGRIDYNKPSYTITTYFNRPGNGTYVHPIHDRMISVREAARFQSFKDDYYFIGKKGDLLKQVGNAVPPFLAYLIAKRIKNMTECKTSIDLFCGAGGLTAGFKQAGIDTILGVDIDKNACLTLKVNNPEINVICDDITKQDVKEKIVSIANENKTDIICAGPPCQGFSHAGKRKVDDSRNQLFTDLIEIIKRTMPKIVVIENVEGILTFLKGRFYPQIVNDISSLGYKVEGRLLLASEYAIPQKRKRVIIICVRDDLNIHPACLFPDTITKDSSCQITAYDAIGDLENIPCGEDSLYNAEIDKLSSYVKMLRNIVQADSYEKAVLSKNDSKTIKQQENVQLSFV